MSALIRQSHANNTDPLWASTQGGEDIVTNEITINPGGAINVGEGGFMTLASSINSSTGIIFNKAVNGSTYTQFQQAYIGGVAPNQAVVLINEASDYETLQLGNLVVYGNAGFGAPNYVSLQGTGTNVGMSYGDNNTRTAFMDVVPGPPSILQLNSSCVGPIPTTFCNTTVAVAPVPNAPALFDSFLITNPYATTSGQEYDFACRGVITLSSGTPDASIDDLFIIKVVVGGATTGTQNYIFNPNAGTWYVRDRLICTTNSTLSVEVQNVNRGTSTAVYDCNMVMGDIVRVK